MPTPLSKYTSKTVVVPSSAASGNDNIKSKDVGYSASAIFLVRKFEKQRRDRERTHEKEIQAFFKKMIASELDKTMRHEGECKEEVRKEKNKSAFKARHPAHTEMGNITVMEKITVGEAADKGDKGDKGDKKRSLSGMLSTILSSLPSLK